jgi:CRISPR-associated protein Cmr6
MSRSPKQKPQKQQPNLRQDNRGGGGRNDPPKPSPWLDPNNEPTPDSTASFVEYLRWMREPDCKYKDSTKVQILHIATEEANYNHRLKQLNERTQLIAGKDNIFG